MVREPPTEQDKILFKLRIKDLESIGIKVATIDEHSQLEVLLKQLIARCRPCRLFIAGSPTEKKPDVGDRYPSIDLPKSMSDFANELGAAFAETSVALSAGASFGAQVGYALLKRLQKSSRSGLHAERFELLRRSKDQPLDEPSHRFGSILFQGRDQREMRDAAREVAATLADTGTTIVSGLARGVDTAAHRGALDASGHTTAVIGTGIDVVFPPENQSLIEQIVRRGAVVSQFPPGLRPSKTSFPVRNAVIAGLSSASVVIEAEELSGTRIEMDYSLEFNRPVLLWAPVLGKRPWARRLAATDDNVHLVCSASEIRELAFQH